MSFTSAFFNTGSDVKKEANDKIDKERQENYEKNKVDAKEYQEQIKET